MLIFNNHNNNNNNEKKFLTKIYRFTGEIKFNNELISEISFENLEKNSKLKFVNEKDCNDYQEIDFSAFIVRRSKIKSPLVSFNLSLNSTSSISPPSPPSPSPPPPPPPPPSSPSS